MLCIFHLPPQTSTALDLVLTTNEDLLYNPKVHSISALPFQLDHFLVSFQLRVSEPASCSLGGRLVFDYSKVDWVGLSNYLSDEDFSICAELNDVDEVWAIIKQIVVTGMKLFIPQFQLKTSQLPKWFTRDLRHRFKCLKSKHRMCSRHPTRGRLSKLELEEVLFTTALKIAKATYENNLITDPECKGSSSIFNYIRHIKKGGSIPNTVTHENVLASTDED